MPVVAAKARVVYGTEAQLHFGTSPSADEEDLSSLLTLRTTTIKNIRPALLFLCLLGSILYSFKHKRKTIQRVVFLDRSVLVKEQRKNFI